MKFNQIVLFDNLMIRVVTGSPARSVAGLHINGSRRRYGDARHLFHRQSLARGSLTFLQPPMGRPCTHPGAPSACHRCRSAARIDRLLEREAKLCRHL